MSTDIYGNLLTAFVILLASSVVVPLIAGKRKLAGWLNFILVTIAGAFFLNISYSVIFDAGSQAGTLINFGPVGIYFLIDSFSGFFIGIIAFMAIISAFYSIEYMEHYHDYSLRGYYLFFPLFILGMIGIVTVDDLSTGFSIAWQIMTIASFFLIRFESKVKENVRSANKYLALMELAWIIILAGTFLIDGIAIGDPLHAITGKLASIQGTTVYLIYGCLLIGFGFKAGMFPLGQLWLPDAHSVAPSPISALLSGVMIKTGVYGIIRTFMWMVPQGEGSAFDGNFWGIVIASFGVVTLFIGTSQALKQHDSKRLHAYHSIGQMGYIIFGIGCALFMFYSESQFVKYLSAIAIIGAIYHTLNHSIFKGLLFLSTGSVQYATGTKDLDKLGGLLKIMPVTGVIAAIASLSIAGIPAFSGFASKWTIISSSLVAGSEVLFLAIFGIIALFTSALTLASYVKFWGMTFASSGAEWSAKKEIKEVPFGMILPKIILAVLCLVQGLFPYYYFSVIYGIFNSSEGSIFAGMLNNTSLNVYLQTSFAGVSMTVPGTNGMFTIVPVIIVLVFACAFIFASFLRKSAGSEQKQADTWLCGYKELDNENRYKSGNMYAAMKNILKWTGGNLK